MQTVSSVASHSPDARSVVIEHFHQGIPGWFTYPRLYRRAVENAPEGGTLVEVGSWMGKSVTFLAVEAINSGKQLRIVAVDSWEDHVPVTSPGSYDGEETYRSYLAHIEPVSDQVRTVRAKSLDAAETFEEESCDFVFIDASHEYQDVLEDLRAWYPKVKPGGVLAGHDYHWPGVNRAVRRFVDERGLTRPAMGELCWIIRLKPDDRSRGQRARDILLTPWGWTQHLIARGRLEVFRRRNDRLRD